MAAQTAIAPAGMRQSSTSGTSINSRPYQADSSIRSLKVLAASTSSKPRTIALARNLALGKERCPAPAMLSISPSPRTHISSKSNGKVDSQRAEREDSVASGSSSSTPLSRQICSSTSPFEDEKSETDIIQPKKEWFLPARAKPGRKPCEVEPPTKRKAQNRASQRAFRERKQSYVASLEEKIEDFEKREAGLCHELQKVARKLKEENNDLRKENKELNEKIRKLQESRLDKENTVKVVESSAMSRTPSQSSSIVIQTATPLIAADTSFWNWSKTEDLNGSASVTPMNRDCGFCTEQSPCVCNGEAVLNLAHGEVQHLPPISSITSLPLSSRNASTGGKGKLWFTTSASKDMGPPPPPSPPQICPTELRSRNNFASNTLPPLQNIPRVKSKLWPIYTSTRSDSIDRPDNSPAIIPVYRLRNDTSAASACSGNPANCNACSTDPALAAFCQAVASHLSPSNTCAPPAILDAGNAIPLRQKRKRSYNSDGSLSKHLISNRPSRIDLYTNQSSQHDSYSQSRQTIPQAWQRISRHPSFPKWQGGLDLLADVVSKRSDADSGDVDKPRVDIEKSSLISTKMSNDRGTDVDLNLHSTVVREEQQDQLNDAKRRRLYVDKESVEDALALLDRSEESCVCPLNRSL